MSTPMAADTIIGPHSLPAWLKNTLVAAATFTLCWVAAIAYWRMTTRSPAVIEIGSCLVGLPLLALSAWFVGRKIMTHPSPIPVASTLQVQASPAAMPSHGALLAILAGAVRTPHGASFEELAAAIAKNKARPDLDHALCDDDGFPIMTARCHEAQNEALQEKIVEWLIHNGFADLEFSEEQWRALILASGVCADLTSHAVINLMPDEELAPLLQVFPVLPADWPTVQCHAAGTWLHHTAAQSGWPAERIVLAPHDEPEPAVISPGALLEKLAQTAAMPTAAQISMIVACASHVGESTVARWSADKTLFTASHPQGEIPGEGAVALLVTNLNRAHLRHNVPSVVIGAMAHARQTVAADEIRHIDPACLGEVIDRATSDASIDAKDIALVVADAGHRSNRMLELMGYMSSTMPGLDGVEDILHVGPACGSCGVVPFFTALAVSRHHALKRQAAVLCVGNEDPYQRIAVVIRPSLDA